MKKTIRLLLVILLTITPLKVNASSFFGGTNYLEITSTAPYPSYNLPLFTPKNDGPDLTASADFTLDKGFHEYRNFNLNGFTMTLSAGLTVIRASGTVTIDNGIVGIASSGLTIGDVYGANDTTGVIAGTGGAAQMNGTNGTLAGGGGGGSNANAGGAGSVAGADGADGSVGGGGGGGGAGAAGGGDTESSGADGGAAGSRGPALAIIASTINISSNINVDGGAGSVGGDGSDTNTPNRLGGKGGGGGGRGGNLFLIGKTITQTAGAITAEGGDGGDGGDGLLDGSAGGGGGGGGQGGLPGFIYIKGKYLTLSGGTRSTAVGTGGTKGTGAGTGGDGGDGGSGIPLLNGINLFELTGDPF